MLPMYFSTVILVDFRALNLPIAIGMSYAPFFNGTAKIKVAPGLPK
jgi:hypothetical protein